MKKKDAVRLLELQVKKIHYENISREEWINSTISVILKIFPISASYKITQIESIENAEKNNIDISKKEKVDIKKRQAERFLKNYIEEIELLDLENKSDKLEDLLNSFIFWVILISAVVISFVGGSLINFH